MISATDLDFPGYRKAPHEAKPTAIGLWTRSTDVWGRRECDPELIAGELYPGRDATGMVEEHLLMLAESGFLCLYRVDGADWLQLLRPLKADTRGASDECPPPPQDRPRMSMAVGGARERAESRVRAEGAERAGVWSEWAGEQERTRTPVRPLLLDAPPIGCPEHPEGRFANCGPCGTARRRHDKWVAQERYTQGLADSGVLEDDEEPW